MKIHEGSHETPQETNPNPLWVGGEKEAKEAWGHIWKGIHYCIGESCFLDTQVGDKAIQEEVIENGSAKITLKVCHAGFVKGELSPRFNGSLIHATRQDQDKLPAEFRYPDPRYEIWKVTQYDLPSGEVVSNEFRRCSYFERRDRRELVATTIIPPSTELPHEINTIFTPDNYRDMISGLALLAPYCIDDAPIVKISNTVDSGHIV